MSSPEFFNSPETIPQTDRFRTIVEDILHKYRWASAEEDELEYATTFKAEVKIDGRPSTLRCGIINTGEQMVHRMVLTQQHLKWEFNAEEVDDEVHIVLTDTSEPAGRPDYVEYDNERMERLLDSLEDGLEQLDYDNEFEVIAAQEEWDAISELEKQFDTPSN